MFFSIFLVLFLASCSTTEAVKKRGGYLLVKNKIKTDNSYLKENELVTFVEQPAINNKLATWFRPGIWFYEKSSEGGQNNLKRFVRKSFGTQPVILDSLKINSTLVNLKQFVTDKGFYHSDVTYKVKYGKTTAQVNYIIKAGMPCVVKKIKYDIKDTLISKFIKNTNKDSKLYPNMIYDTYVLDDERARVTNILREEGYFSFTKNHIYYMVDTAKAQTEAIVSLVIDKYKIRNSNGDTIKEINHPRYITDSIRIETEKYEDAVKMPINHTSTYSYRIGRRDTTLYDLYIQSNGQPWLRPQFFSSNLKLLEGEIYNQKNANLTYKRLINHPTIKAVKINITPSISNTMIDGELQKIDYDIKVSKTPPHSLSIGTEGTNSEGRLGVGVNLTYLNKNIFKGAEVFSFKIRSNGEIQANSKDDPSQIGKIFTAFGWGGETSLEFPRLLIPYRYPIMQRVKLGKTTIATSLGFEYRKDLTKTGSALGITYNWEQSNEKIRHILTPFEFNYIKTKISPDFQEYLDNLADPLYKTQFTDHFLTIIKYSIIYTDAITSTGLYKYFVRTNVESSGNLVYAFDKMFNNTLKNGYYEHLGVRYSQYIKGEIDFQRFWRYSLNHTLAIRFNTGIIAPYGNSITVPFEKSFWLGGANDMRGWKLRSLGPGGYISPNKRFDKIGNILLLANIERRFPVSGIVKGAFFADAGNVWLLKKSANFPEGEFNFSKFFKQLALDAGFGIRVDASFLIVRLDWALKIHNPGVTENKWFQPKNFTFSDINWNIGIGYPF